MRKILLLTISLIYCIAFGQDLDYNILFKGDDGVKFYGKREANNVVWIKIQEKNTKQKLKNGNIITKEGKVTKIQHQCDCFNNKMRNLTFNSYYEPIDSETLAQLIFDYSCSDLVYNDFIGETEDGWAYYLGDYKKNGKYIDVWVKQISTSDFIPEQILIFDSKTGKSNPVSAKEGVFEKVYDIQKYTVDCNNKKIAHIVNFRYNASNSRLDDMILPEYYNELGFADINSELGGESYKFIYEKVCRKED